MKKEYDDVENNIKRKLLECFPETTFDVLRYGYVVSVEYHNGPIEKDVKTAADGIYSFAYKISTRRWYSVEYLWAVAKYIKELYDVEVPEVISNNHVIYYAESDVYVTENKCYANSVRTICNEYARNHSFMEVVSYDK